jgi:hypothetical protein
VESGSVEDAVRWFIEVFWADLFRWITGAALEAVPGKGATPCKVDYDSLKWETLDLHGACCF